MSNILPHDAKKTVWALYRTRFIIAGSLVALLAAGVSSLALLPSYLVLRSAAVPSVSSNKSSKAKNDADRAAIASVRGMVTILSPFVATTTRATAAITQALSLRPRGISVDHISYAAETSGRILLTGSSASREAISGYRQALSADPHFKTVSIPVGDLTGEPGARFAMTLLGAF